MSINLDDIIPLGRRASEYKAMFNLENIKQDIKILDCGGGPSSFNFEMNKQKISVTSIDPLYQFSTIQISKRIDETFENMMTQLSNNKDKFIWSHFSTAEDVRKTRQTAMQMFLKDYENGKTEKRYIHAQLPVLPFEDKVFDIALCSHLLFLYSDNLSYEFHIESIIDMLRVAKEVRIFPVVDLNSNESPYLKNIIDFFKLNNYDIKLQKVKYEFQKNANKMLIIKK